LYAAISDDFRMAISWALRGEGEAQRKTRTRARIDHPIRLGAHRSITPVF
jgi:hypothetical protein